LFDIVQKTPLTYKDATAGIYYYLN